MHVRCDMAKYRRPQKRIAWREKKTVLCRSADAAAPLHVCGRPAAVVGSLYVYAMWLHLPALPCGLRMRPRKTQKKTVNNTTQVTNRLYCSCQVAGFKTKLRRNGKHRVDFVTEVRVLSAKISFSATFSLWRAACYVFWKIIWRVMCVALFGMCYAIWRALRCLAHCYAVWPMVRYLIILVFGAHWRWGNAIWHMLCHVAYVALSDCGSQHQHKKDLAYFMLFGLCC